MCRLSLCAFKKWLIQALLTLGLTTSMAFSAPLNVSQSPLFVGTSVSPLIMLLLEKSHGIFLPAYNDMSDLNGDGAIDYRFIPSITYAGYFDSLKCYSYDAGNQYFYPISLSSPSASGNLCTGNWSGNFLNYLTMSRLDIIRQSLYGGYRSTDTPTTTVLERAQLVQDAHSFGKQFNKSARDFYQIQDFTPLNQPTGENNFHLFINTTVSVANGGTGLPLLRIVVNTRHNIWDWAGIPPPSGGNRFYNGSTGTPINDTILEYVVRVKVCDPAISLESNCKTYPSGDKKPTGVLQTYGENNSALFGLMTGSYDSNMTGGLLRKNIGSITDEINADTGQFTNINGIISNINKIKLRGFGSNYIYDCGSLTTRIMNNGECQMWGNPIAQMLYEAIRYFAGKSGPTAAYVNGNTNDTAAGLAAPAWVNPYSVYPSCSKPIALVMSTSSPSYDSKLMPGSAFLGIASDISPSLDVSGLGQTIFNNAGLPNNVMAFVGQSGVNGDGTPTPKVISSFGNIQGLSSSEANNQGSYYTASVAYYGWLNRIAGTQKLRTIVFEFAPRQAQIRMNVGGKIITVAPFAKSVNGLGINPAQGQFQPNDEIVNFFIENISSTQEIVMVNYSNVQQAGNYSMSAQVEYTITVNNNNTLTVKAQTLNSSGSVTQHLGYTISGTTADGIYLVVKDTHTSNGADIDYYLDTPAGQGPGGVWQDNQALPTTDTRTFTPGNNPTTNLNSPLWYAAKWGGFTDSNNNNYPDITTEFSSTGSADPDNYISGTNPSALNQQLNNQLNQATDHIGTFSMPILTNNTLQSGTILYQSIFQVNKWQGDLLAYSMNINTGTISFNGSARFGAIWSAQSLLNNTQPNNRSILTYNPTARSGAGFLWSAPLGQVGISAAQQALLNTNPATGLTDTFGQDRLNFLRGDRSKEIPQPGGVFRQRGSTFGDIINSHPVYIAGPNQNYPDTWGVGAAENASPYSSFKSGSAASRTPAIYVGANDGMLHAFNATTGSELFAYVPSSVYPTLNQLTNPTYTHQFYVDGTPTVIDAFINNAWRTMLVGHLNAGGQGVYAIDVTDPTQVTQSNAANVVKWEFTDQNDPDMGMSFSQPSIVRLQNGQWAAVFGNGYNNTYADGTVSTTGNAVLYIVDLNTGALIKKFDTGVGMAQDPSGKNRPNGMSSAAVVSANGNYIADFIYAGDLFGNLWKIDISSANPAQWDFSFKTNNSPVPFFVASDSQGNRQPITSKPAVAGYAYRSNGFKIYVGTGKYLENADITDTSVQSIYGLFDAGTSIPDRSSLLTQTITFQDSTYRTVSANSLTSQQKGWVLDLVYGNANGERLFSPIRYMNKKISFTTLIPSNDPCLYGGTSWIMEINALNGSNLNYNAFISPNAVNPPNIIPSGMFSSNGITSAPAILQAGTTRYYFTAGTNGNLTSATGNPGTQSYGRQSWRQLQ